MVCEGLENEGGDEQGLNSLYGKIKNYVLNSLSLSLSLSLGIEDLEILNKNKNKIHQGV